MELAIEMITAGSLPECPPGGVRQLRDDEAIHADAGLAVSPMRRVGDTENIIILLPTIVKVYCPIVGEFVGSEV